MKRSSIGLAATTILLALAGLAAANDGKISDPKGDVTNNPPGNDANYDIVRATFGHGHHGKLKHTVTVDGKIGNPTSSGPNAGSQPLMFIDVPHHNFTGGCDYRINGVPPGVAGNTTDHTKYYVFKCSNGPNQPKTGTAAVTRTSSDTDRVEFKPKAIGSPSKYGWAFDFITDTNQGLADADRAPDKGFKVHRL